MQVERIPLGALQANCYFLHVGNEVAIIDPGADEPAIREKIANCGQKIKYILLTHRHCDHLMGTAAAKELTGAEVVISEADAVGLSDPLASLAKDISYEKQICLSPDRTVNEPDTLTLGGEEIHVMATPGHTVGGVCYRIGDLLFTGDTLFKGNCGRCDLPTGSFPTMLQSLKKLAMLNGDYTVYPGHGDQTTLEQERKNNPYMR